MHSSLTAVLICAAHTRAAPFGYPSAIFWLSSLIKGRKPSDCWGHLENCAEVHTSGHCGCSHSCRCVLQLRLQVGRDGGLLEENAHLIVPEVSPIRARGAGLIGPDVVLLADTTRKGPLPDCTPWPQALTPHASVLPFCHHMPGHQAVATQAGALWAEQIVTTKNDCQTIAVSVAARRAPAARWPLTEALDGDTALLAHAPHTANGLVF
jgi:hypothetical protein